MAAKIWRARIAAIVIAALLGACTSKPEEADNNGSAVQNVRLNKDQLSHVRIFTVAPVGYRQRIHAPGTVDFNNDQTTAIVAPFTGPVVRTLVALGQHVEKGQPLAFVQSADYATAVGAYRKAEVTARNARRLANTDRDLAAHNGISAREAQQAQTDAASAEADREAALQSLIALGVDRGAIGSIQSGGVPAAVIRAPVSGYVVEKQITPGQLLQSGTTPTFTVANISQVWVLAQISSSDLASVGLHDVADIDPGNGTGIFHGVVDNISASVNPDTRAVTARIVANNPGGLLKKQMFVDVSIESGRVSTGLLVPVSAVLRDDQNLPFVYIALPGGAFARRHVTLGYRDSQNVDITSGLSTGDRIVADGAIFLQFMQSQ